MSKVSICMPVYEARGSGIKLLSEAFNSIKKQTYKDFEVIISDHSVNDEIKLFCDASELPIKYFKFGEKYNNGPANTNNAIKHATGKYIKLLFQDDILKTNQTLEKMVNELENSDAKWLTSSCDHFGLVSDTCYRNHVPEWGTLSLPTNIEDYMNCKPTIGSPSLILYEKSDDLRFDENLVIYMDVDFYYNLIKKYSKPVILQDILITIRIWPGSITSNTSVNLNEEKCYMLNKYKGV